MRAIALFLLWIANARAESCVFDHVLVTLPVDAYQALEAFFKEPGHQKQTGTTWHATDDGMKAFLAFEDTSYLEVWNQSKYDKYGYQDACRVKRKERLEELARGYHVTPQIFGHFMVAGRRGGVGDPDGGMFFIWDPERKIDPNKPGIREIVKSVATTAELVEDYLRAGLKIERGPTSLRAIDDAGTARFVIGGPKKGLLAVRFSRTGSERETLPIKNGIEVVLSPGEGALRLTGTH